MDVPWQLDLLVVSLLVFRGWWRLQPLAEVVIGERIQFSIFVLVMMRDVDRTSKRINSRLCTATLPKGILKILAVMT